MKHLALDEVAMKRQSPPFIRQRYVLVTLAFIGLACVYAMRVNLNVAMVAMVKSRTPDKPAKHTGFCPLPNATTNTTHEEHQKLDGRFDWDLYTQGIILGAFYYGYIVTPIPGGRMAERFGAKWLFGIGTFITAFLGFLIPAVARSTGSTGLIILRVLQGLGEGVTYPAVEAHIAHWLPIDERTTGISIVHTGGFSGVVIGMLLSGYLSDSDWFGGWPSVFYVFGSVTMVWFVFWCIFTADRPEDHRWISHYELDYINKSLKDQKPTHATSTPWKKIFTSPAVLAVAFSMFGANWLQYMLITELPTYLGTVLHFDIEQNGLYSSLPYLGAVLAGIVAGPLADFLRRKNYATPTNIRKSFNAVALILPSAVLVSVVWLAKCDGGTSLILFVIAGTLRGFCEAGYMSIPVDMAPDYAGTIIGICICFGNTTGFLVPWITGLLISEENSTRTWSYNFYLTGALCSTTAVIFQLFASAEVQPWGLASKQKQTAHL